MVNTHRIKILETFLNYQAFKICNFIILLNYLFTIFSNNFFHVESLHGTLLKKLNRYEAYLLHVNGKEFLFMFSEVLTTLKSQTLTDMDISRVLSFGR